MWICCAQNMVSGSGIALSRPEPSWKNQGVLRRGKGERKGGSVSLERAGDVPAKGLRGRGPRSRVWSQARAGGLGQVGAPELNWARPGRQCLPGFGVAPRRGWGWRVSDLEGAKGPASRGAGGGEGPYRSSTGSENEGQPPFPATAQKRQPGVIVAHR